MRSIGHGRHLEQLLSHRGGAPEIIRAIYSREQQDRAERDQHNSNKDGFRHNVFLWSFSRTETGICKLDDLPGQSFQLPPSGQKVVPVKSRRDCLSPDSLINQRD